jgi:hypothetical protein
MQTPTTDVGFPSDSQIKRWVFLALKPSSFLFADQNLKKKTPSRPSRTSSPPALGRESLGRVVDAAGPRTLMLLTGSRRLASTTPQPPIVATYSLTRRAPWLSPLSSRGRQHQRRSRVPHIATLPRRLHFTAQPRVGDRQLGQPQATMYSSPPHFGR